MFMCSRGRFNTECSREDLDAPSTTSSLPLSGGEIEDKTEVSHFDTTERIKRRQSVMTERFFKKAKGLFDSVEKGEFQSIPSY